ncbi:MAG: hypothetical protein AB1486_32430 [Planctomycetota bacterium]
MTNTGASTPVVPSPSKRAGERYREFRQDLQQLRAIDLNEKRILLALAEVRATHYD